MMKKMIACIAKATNKDVKKVRPQTEIQTSFNGILQGRLIHLKHKQYLLKTVVAVPTHVVVVVARVEPDLSRVTFLKFIFCFPEL